MSGDRAVRAVLFDVDGTLYHAGALRRRVMLALLRLPLSGPRRARRTIHYLRCYRHALEQVRYRTPDAAGVVTQHLLLAAELAGAPPEAVRVEVEEWMLRRPLRYLRRCRRAGLVEFLDMLRHNGIPAGVFSDYPVADKLDALGILDRAALCLSAGDPEINAFKPDPRGFLHACDRWGLQPAQVLYVGDRPELDAVGATAAGMPCAIIGNAAPAAAGGPSYIPVSGFAELARVLERLSGAEV
ncbi:MAG: HAD family hydrolase [Planctomycetes bacterium]|nr:HAD family hydrolase [Planctomycetota bacterium]MCB9868519.1 HAD family hydrolase [Planctomycetota bacterium]